MDVKKRKRLNRKRKHEAETEVQYNVAQNNNRRFDEKAQAEEEELTRDLFGDSAGFLKSLEEVALCSKPSTSSSVDSGVGETETEGSSSDESKRRPVWFDEDDEGIDVGSALDAQGRKLPSAGINSRSNQYSNLLQNKFKSLVGTPKWAKLDREQTGDESEDELLQTCGHIVKSKSHFLKSSTLEFKKVKDLNIETSNEGPKITTIEFHPSSTVALVAGVSGIASLMAVDGKRNNKLHSVAFKRFPIECGRFLNNGSEALLGSRHPHFYLYDLLAAKSVNINLPKGITHCKKFEVSPTNNVIAICGKWGEVHLLSADSKELITTLKQNSNVTALAFNTDGSQLFGHSDMGEVTIWDVGSRRVKHKFTDDGCLQGTVLTISPSGQYLAAGSAQGVVNLYEVDTILKEKIPKPKKIIMNLTTAITSLKFNSTSEILGFSSSELANSVRLLHVSSGTVFSNFPQFSTKLGRISTVSFSPNSGYAAFGNFNSTVALYRLKHFNNY